MRLGPLLSSFLVLSQGSLLPGPASVPSILVAQGLRSSGVRLQLSLTPQETCSPKLCWGLAAYFSIAG